MEGSSRGRVCDRSHDFLTGHGTRFLQSLRAQHAVRLGISTQQPIRDARRALVLMPIFRGGTPANGLMSYDVDESVTGLTFWTKLTRVTQLPSIKPSFLASDIITTRDDFHDHASSIPDLEFVATA